MDEDLAFGQGDDWLAWAKKERSSGVPDTWAKWMIERWITADEAVFRIPRFHVVELCGHRSGIKWRESEDPFGPPKLDAHKLAKHPNLKEKQETFIARQLQRGWRLSHLLPSAWDRLDDERFT